MSAAVHAFARSGAVGRPPLVPAKAILKDGAKLQTDPDWFESRWYRSCSPTQALAGLALRVRSVKQEPAGSFDDDDVELAHLADFGRDVDGWMAAKAKVLEGWVLCSDNRWHHPEIARNVLHIWLGRLDSRRVSAWANASKGKDSGDYGLCSILDDIDDALAALRALDPQDAVLRKATKVASDWRKRVAELFSPAGHVPARDESVGGTTPIRFPIGLPNREPQEGGPKRSEAKLSEANLESHMPDRRSGHDLTPSKEDIERGRFGSLQLKDARETYPTDAFAIWYNRFPLKEARKKAEAAFGKVQTSGLVNFPDLMSGLERYIRNKPKGQDWCYPASWLNEERWRDGIPVPVETSPSPFETPTASLIFIKVDTPDWEAWKQEARRLGKVGWPIVETCEGRGWRFPSARPPDPSSPSP